MVAQEVKTLAGSTSKATGEVTGRVQAIQSDTRAVEAALGEVRAVVGRIDVLHEGIVGAVQDQGNLTREMIAELLAAQGECDRIGGTIDRVGDAAQAASVDSARLEGAARELAALSHEMRDAVGRFRWDRSDRWAGYRSIPS